MENYLPEYRPFISNTALVFGKFPYVLCQSLWLIWPPRIQILFDLSHTTFNYSYSPQDSKQQDEANLKYWSHPYPKCFRTNQLNKSCKPWGSYKPGGFIIMFLYYSFPLAWALIQEQQDPLVTVQTTLAYREVAEKNPVFWNKPGQLVQTWEYMPPGAQVVPKSGTKFTCFLIIMGSIFGLIVYLLQANKLSL